MKTPPALKYYPILAKILLDGALIAGNVGMKKCFVSQERGTLMLEMTTIGPMCEAITTNCIRMFGEKCYLVVAESFTFAKNRMEVKPQLCPPLL